MEFLEKYYKEHEIFIVNNRLSDGTIYIKQVILNSIEKDLPHHIINLYYVREKLSYIVCRRISPIVKTIVEEVCRKKSCIC